MENYYIRNFEKLWNIDSTIIQEIDDFETILKILSSGKLKNDIIWKVMHDWINVDTFNRLTHFKQFFNECFQLDYQSRQFVKNEVFSSEIFRLLPIKFQTELEEFAEKVLQPPYTELSETDNVIEHTFRSPETIDEPPQQLTVAESILLPKTVADYVTKNDKQLLVCIKKYGSVEFYNPQHKSWHLTPVSFLLPNKQYNFELALLGSMLYAFGGRDDDYKVTKQMWSRDLSDPSSQWTASADMKLSRELFCTVVLNDTIYALGGRDYDNSRSCERYCSKLNEWSTVADMNTYHDRAFKAAVINGCIYVAGGKDGEKALKSVSKYDPQIDTWSEVAPMTSERKHFALTPFAGRLWAIGGRDGDGGREGNGQLLRSCESYDPVTDTWREEAPMKEGRWDHAAIEFNGELYVVGGRIWNEYMLGSTVVEKYVPTTGWVKDSQLQRACTISHLLVIPPAFTSFFTTEQSKPAV